MKYTAHVQQLQENFDITFLKNLKPHLKVESMMFTYMYIYNYFL